jgi:hypothetical protein
VSRFRDSATLEDIPRGSKVPVHHINLGEAQFFSLSHLHGKVLPQGHAPGSSFHSLLLTLIHRSKCVVTNHGLVSASSSFFCRLFPPSARMHTLLLAVQLSQFVGPSPVQSGLQLSSYVGTGLTGLSSLG